MAHDSCTSIIESWEAVISMLSAVGSTCYSKRVQTHPIFFVQASSCPSITHTDVACNSPPPAQEARNFSLAAWHRFSGGRLVAVAAASGRRPQGILVWNLEIWSGFGFGMSLPSVFAKAGMLHTNCLGMFFFWPPASCF